jgi:hypothetical protein
MESILPKNNESTPVACDSDYTFGRPHENSIVNAYDDSNYIVNDNDHDSLNYNSINDDTDNSLKLIDSITYNDLHIYSNSDNELVMNESIYTRPIEYESFDII